MAFKERMLVVASGSKKNNPGDIPARLRPLPSNRESTTNTSVVFLPRPPASLPLCVRQIAQHGYWFMPDFQGGEKPFELVVESSKDCVRTLPFAS